MPVVNGPVVRNRTDRLHIPGRMAVIMAAQTTYRGCRADSWSGFGGSVRSNPTPGILGE